MPTESLLGPLQRLLAGALLLLGVIAVEGVGAEMNPAPWASLALSYAMLLPGLAVSYRFSHRQPQHTHGEPPTLPPSGLMCLIALILLPWPTEWLREALLGFSLPLEVLLLMALRNLAVGLALATHWRSALRCALAAAAFMTFAAATMALGAWVRWVLLSYGLVACLWLLLGYWRRLEGEEAARRLPIGITLGVLLLLAGLASLIVVGPERLATTLGSWLPSSGGDQGQSANARGGLGDGDEVTKARQAPRSVGISDSDLVLETEQPSLYDLVTEQYGPPLKMKEVEQAESMDARKQKQDFAVAENLKVSREFPLLRQRPKPKDEESTLPDALLYLEGPTPQHLRLQTFTEFDGRAWQATELAEAALALKKDEGSNWFTLEYLEPSPLAAGEVRLAVKITKLGGRVFPLPGGVTRFRLGKLSQSRFFARTQGDLLGLADRDLPTGLTLEADVRTYAWDQLGEHAFVAGSLGQRIFQQLPAGWTDAPRVRALAEQWTRNVPQGWPAIQAVIQKLRTEYTLEPHFRPAPDCPSAVADFLFVSRRGPDYQFASAAAVLLRSLGYPTRLVSGFYADPRRFDGERGHTLIQREDVHTWLEVLGPGRWWVTLEPTPGYAVAASFYPWHVRLGRWLWAGWTWVADRPLSSAAAFALLAFVYLGRRRLADWGATAWWRLRPTADWRQHTLATVQLLERRAHWAGCPRPVGASPARWYRQLVPTSLEDWATLAEAALYDPTATDVTPAEASRRCHAAATALSYRELRQLTQRQLAERK